MKIIKAPNNPKLEGKWIPRIFLAGSIEMGKAIDWQTHITESLLDLECVIYNPRRDDWDKSWVQTIDNPPFHEQVNWELDRLGESTIIVMYFDPSTMSPISLLELGLFAHKNNRLIVCCPEGFWRKGNVDIVCKRYGIQQVDNIKDLIKEVREIIEFNEKN